MLSPNIFLREILINVKRCKRWSGTTLKSMSLLIKFFKKKFFFNQIILLKLLRWIGHLSILYILKLPIICSYTNKERRFKSIVQILSSEKPGT